MQYEDFEFALDEFVKFMSETMVDIDFADALARIQDKKRELWQQANERTALTVIRN